MNQKGKMVKKKKKKKKKKKRRRRKVSENCSHAQVTDEISQTEVELVVFIYEV